MKNKIKLILLSILLLQMTLPHRSAQATKIYTDEFLFVDSYLERLSEYIDISGTALILYIAIAPIEKGIYYSEEDVINSDFMKKLKTEQTFISKIMRKMNDYTTSPIPSIEITANEILKIYQKRKDINIKAQDSYFYTKTRQFKAGLSESDELADKKQNITSNMEINFLVHDVLLPKDSSTLKVTCKEKESLKKKIEDLKQYKFYKDLFLKGIDDLFNANIPCLKNITSQ